LRARPSRLWLASLSSRVTRASSSQPSSHAVLFCLSSARSCRCDRSGLRVGVGVEVGHGLGLGLGPPRDCTTRQRRAPKHVHRAARLPASPPLPAAQLHRRVCKCQRKESPNFDRRRVRKERRASSRPNARQRPAGNVTSARGRLPASPPLRAAKLESCPQSHAVSASMEMRIRALDEDDRLHLVLEHTKDTMREIAVSTSEFEHRGTEAVADICERGRAHARKQIQRARPMRRCTGASLACSRTRHAARGMRASKKICLPVGPRATQAGSPCPGAALRLL
jgi:hypothetical protein